MKRLILPCAVLLLSFSALSNAVSATNDVVVEGSVTEVSYITFNPGDHIKSSTEPTIKNNHLNAGSASPVPGPTAFWLFGTALLGFVGLSCRTSLS